MRARPRARHQAIRRRMARVSRALSYPGIARCFWVTGTGSITSPTGARSCRGRSAARSEHAPSRCSSAPRSSGRTTDRSSRSRPFARARTSRERRGLIDIELSFDALSLGPLFDVGAWDELLQVADDVLRRSRQAGGDYAAGLAQPWLTQVLLWRGRPAEASDAAAESTARSANIRTPRSSSRPRSPPRSSRSFRPHQDAIRIIEELERETEVSLAWYRENFLADLVRICVVLRRLPLARRLVDALTSPRARHHLSLLSASAAMAEALGRPRCHGAVPTGRRGLDRVRPSARDRRSRCSGRAVPRAAA